MNVFKKIATRGKYQDAYSIPALVDYIMNPAKRMHNIIGGYNVNRNDIAESMIAVSQKFNKDSGVRLHHFIVSLDHRDVYSPGMLQDLGEMICSRFCGEYQIIYALHEDRDHLHFMFNAVSFVDGHRFHSGPAECFFSILKTECIYRQKIATLQEAQNLTDDFIEFYNNERIQLKTGQAPLTQRLSA